MLQTLSKKKKKKKNFFLCINTWDVGSFTLIGFGFNYKVSIWLSELRKILKIIQFFWESKKKKVCDKRKEDEDF